MDALSQSFVENPEILMFPSFYVDNELIRVWKCLKISIHLLFLYVFSLYTNKVTET